MRIEELLSEEKIGDYFNRLVKSHGIQALGSGAYARVFQHPVYKNVVVKVYKATDKQYIKYVNWALKNQSNPWVPKIIEQVEYKSKDGNLNLVFMQKLKPFADTREAANAMMRAAYKANPKLSKDEQDDLTDIIFEALSYGDLYPWIDFVTDTQLAKKDKHFGKLWNDFIMKNQKAFDLHEGNMMYRVEDGQVVITDPLGSQPTSWVSDI